MPCLITILMAGGYIAIDNHFHMHSYMLYSYWSDVINRSHDNLLIPLVIFSHETMKHHYGTVDKSSSEQQISGSMSI